MRIEIKFDRGGIGMKYLIWLVGGIAALDQGMKSEIEQETDGEFPRDLPGAKGRIRIHRNHNYGFPFGFLKEKPQLVTAVPLAVSSAVAGALSMLLVRKGCGIQKVGLSMVLGGALSNLYDRFKRGYVVDYFSFSLPGIKKVVFNLGDLFVFLGTALFLLDEMGEEFKKKVD